LCPGGFLFLCYFTFYHDLSIPNSVISNLRSIEILSNALLQTLFSKFHILLTTFSMGNCKTAAPSGSRPAECTRRHMITRMIFISNVSAYQSPIRQAPLHNSRPEEDNTQINRQQHQTHKITNRTKECGHLVCILYLPFGME
jgi:hypothetical protein